PAGNTYPHTVTSITWTGMAPTRTLTSGLLFDSSPTREQYLLPGDSFTLDTTTLDPGQYLYYCTLHPWMVGSITVAPAETSPHSASGAPDGDDRLGPIGRITLAGVSAAPCPRPALPLPHPPRRSLQRCRHTDGRNTPS